MAQPLKYFFEDQIIEVPAPGTSLDIQYLVDQTRDTEDELWPAMPYVKIMDAFGKQPLGGGTFVGITVMLLNNWRIRFEEREGPDTVSQSFSPTIATPAENIDLKYLIGSLSDTQKYVGNSYYWDPVSGNDTTSASVIVIYTTDRTILVRVRRKAATAILPFETTGTFSLTGYSTSCIRTLVLEQPIPLSAK